MNTQTELKLTTSNELDFLYEDHKYDLQLIAWWEFEEQLLVLHDI